MPELPEVQTIVSDLNMKIKGEIVTSFWSDWKKGIRGNLRKFKKEIEGKKIINVERIGKNILLKLSGGTVVLIHLRMTGALLVKSQIPKFKEKYTHHIFFLKSGKRLEFSDIRKFGSLELIKISKKEKMAGLKGIGIDILDKKFTLSEFNRVIESRKTNIKQILLDQRKMAGIGNIYANEIIYEAGINPKRSTSSLRPTEKKAIYFAIKKIIKKAIKFRGTSISDYRDSSGERGKFQKMLKVYQRAGQKCSKCDTIIKRSAIGQRSTFHCPKCQK
jgi:formamidopyrimidine-DNA glycosylase